MIQTSLFHKIIEGCFNEIYLIDLQSALYIQANQVAQDRLGWSLADLQAMHPWQLARDFTEASWQRQLQPLLTDAQSSLSLTTHHTPKNGAPYAVELKIQRSLSDGQDILIVTGRDLSMDQHAVASHAACDERATAIVANLPGVVMQLCLQPDRSIQYLFLSANCDSTLGVTPETLYGDPDKFIDLILPEDRFAYSDSMQQSALTNSHWNWEGRICVAQWNDIKWINLRAVPRYKDDGCVIWEGIITNVTMRKVIELELDLNRQRLTELSVHVDRIKEQERMRIAREIHDEMGGNLVAAKMILHTLENRLPGDQPWLADKTKYIDTLIDRTIDAAHRISRDLRPGILDLGLIPALEWQIREFEKQSGIRCAFSTNQSEISLTPDQATALFRMVQEALTNIGKHAQASFASLVIVYTRNNISLTIADNGCGLRVGHGSRPNSFGLLGMTERCREIGGSLDIYSEPDQGCQITIKVPLRDAVKSQVPEQPDDAQLSLL